MKAKKILYIRSAPYELNFKSYNSQEVGLAAAFCKKGYDFDIFYYGKKNRNQVMNYNGRKIQVFWRKGIKFLRTGIYPSILNKNFFSEYDAVIVSEYNQIMSVIVSYLTENVYIYNGPYYNLFKLPILQTVYDFLFVKIINTRIKKIFVKSELSKEFLETKGIQNSVVVGVGLDVNKFDKEGDIKEKTQILVDKMVGKRNLLYVGSLSKRKNISSLIKIFKRLKEDPSNGDIQLVLVGKGNKEYINKCLKVLNSEEKHMVILCPSIDNSQLKYVYSHATLFLLPSLQEIFGMVLLEAMYFGVPCISSVNGGSETLIKSGYNGIIVETDDIERWSSNIKFLLENNKKRLEMGQRARKTIENEFMWEDICEKMMANMRLV